MSAIGAGEGEIIGKLAGAAGRDPVGGRRGARDVVALGPRRDGASLHVHGHHSALFYVLDGELTVKLGPDADEVAVPAGSVARVSPMVVHGFRNASEVDVTVRDRLLRADAGTFVQVPRGVEHSVEADGRYLSVHAPNAP